MTTFLKIPDKIVELSKEQIKPRYIKPYLPVLLILTGALFLYIGGVELHKNQIQAFLIASVGFVFIIAAVILLLTNRRYFVLVKNGKRIRARRFNLFPEEQEKIVQLMHQDKLNEVLKYTINKSTPLQLELWYNKSHDKVYAQVLHYHDAGMRAITLVHVSNYLDLDIPYKAY